MEFNSDFIETFSILFVEYNNSATTLSVRVVARAVTGVGNIPAGSIEFLPTLSLINVSAIIIVDASAYYQFTASFWSLPEEGSGSRCDKKVFSNKNYDITQLKTPKNLIWISSYIEEVVSEEHVRDARFYIN